MGCTPSRKSATGVESEAYTPTHHPDSAPHTPSQPIVVPTPERAKVNGQVTQDQSQFKAEAKDTNVDKVPASENTDEAMKDAAEAERTSGDGGNSPRRSGDGAHLPEPAMEAAGSRPGSKVGPGTIAAEVEESWSNGMSHATTGGVQVAEKYW